ncbi:NADP-dependent oxidoreductase [Thalassotalea psychrophila]|uniref:NADP-dependent oxidoreductase n=1 Tax=Thalassotalea psychrophila TaxID=3065647 RepID=A0ABY9TUF6_9GAMM|nr:NADP-dependent oxidoreductase [Colwelliaceae bacterium SQ149]
MRHQQAWIINEYAKGDLTGNELSLVEIPQPDLNDGEVLIKTLLLSLDPSNRLWLSEEKDYLPQLQIGDVMRGLVVGRVEESKDDNFKVGDHVFAMLGWQQYAVVPAKQLTAQNGAIKFKPHPQIPLEAYVSALGLTGWTAFVGMHHIGNIKPDSKVLVSGAAGATGLAASQIAKATGCYTVGIAGGAQKCELLCSQFNMDGAIDYRSEQYLSAAMKAQFPNGIDVFFDNVGGEMLDAALENMAMNGVVVISGSISQYQTLEEKDKVYGLKNSFMLATKRLRMEGFLILDYLEQMDTILPTMEQWLLDGKLQYRNTTVDGLGNAQAALPRLFSGRNTGKLVINVAD